MSSIEGFDALVSQVYVDRPSTFRLIDQFTVYSYYIEESLGLTDIVVGKNMLSPLRDGDKNPSFRLFFGNNDSLLFTDYGDKNKTGDVITFVALLFNISEIEANRKILADWGLLDAEIEVKIPKRELVVKPRKELGIKTRDFTKEELAFWNAFHIGLSTLKYFNVYGVEWILWDGMPMRPKSMGFAYRIGKYYKLYSPFDKEHKFVSGFPIQYVEGAMQLKYKSDLLIITKSTKDCMVLYEMGYEAISPLSENSPIPGHILNKIVSKYKHVVVFFDNDGKASPEHYPYPSITLPVEPRVTDISDYAKKHGLYKAKQILTQLLCY